MATIRTICFLSWIQGVGLLSALGSEPQGQFWIIRAANETAGPLVEAVEGKTLPPAELASRISALIDAKKIQELARFDQAPGGETFSHGNVTGEMRFPDGDDKIDLGVKLEGQVTLLNKHRSAEFRIVAEIREKKSRNVFYKKSINSGRTVYGDGWELMNFWKNAKESTLYLARVTDYPAAAVAEPEPTATVLHVELLEIQPEDLVQFRKSTPATREKAVNWLHGRSKLLAATDTTSRPGQQFSHEDGVASLSGQRGGFTLLSEQTTSGDGRKVDITLNAQWQDPEKPADEEEFQFSVGATLDEGQAELFEPSARRPSKRALPVLLVTPQVRLSKENSPLPPGPKDPGALPDKITTLVYPVAPRFMRIVLGTNELNHRPGISEALAKRGLESPPGTSVAMDAQSCAVYLTHSREGHLKFMSLLKELDLLP